MVRATDPAQAGAVTTTPTDPPTTGPAGPPSGAGRPEGPPPRSDVRDLGRLRRTREPHKHVAGVAGGLARHLDVDPLVVRVAFAVLALFGGAGVLLYVVAWAVVPEEGTEQTVLRLDERSRTVALVVAGALALLSLLGDSWGWYAFPWPLAVVALAVWLVLRRRPSQAPAWASTTGVPPGTPTWGAAPPGTPGAAGVPYAAPVPPAVPVPKRRGPLLLPFALALSAIGIGVLVSLDVGGLDVPPGGYAAVVVGVVGALLVVGAFAGRAGGLIALGLVAAAALALGTAADDWEEEVVTDAPTTSAEVEDDRYLGAGEQRLDLSGITDPEALAGRTLTVEGGVGRIVVVLPRGVDVEVDAKVGGFGSIDLLGSDRGGLSPERTVLVTADAPVAPASAAPLEIDVELGVGEIVVEEAP